MTLIAGYKRQEYPDQPLEEATVAADPLDQFEHWYKDAVAAKLASPDAMILATASAARVPSARSVLFKKADSLGLIFYTNELSRKARELAENPLAALVFPWHGLGRELRIEGRIEKLSLGDSAMQYFFERPLESQIVSLASAQSQVLARRETLMEKMQALRQHWQPQQALVLAHWRAYRLQPLCYEFWQGRPHRLNDRLRYRREGSQWVLERLEP